MNLFIELVSTSHFKLTYLGISLSYGMSDSNVESLILKKLPEKKLKSCTSSACLQVYWSYSDV